MHSIPAADDSAPIRQKVSFTSKTAGHAVAETGRAQGARPVETPRKAVR